MISNAVKNILTGLFVFWDLGQKTGRIILRGFGARHANLSGTLSLDDSPGTANAELIDLSLRAIDSARAADIGYLRKRNVPSWVSTWPGEHYQLLPGLVDAAHAEHIVEIGTYTGISTIVLGRSIPENGSVTTFDILPWDSLEDTALSQSDFDQPNVQQTLADLGNLETARKHSSTLAKADLIFIDAAKDGQLERALLDNFSDIGLKDGCILVFDDIKDWNMIKIWREISMPKLDITSFGHWAGTGIIQWKSNFRWNQK